MRVSDKVIMACCGLLFMVNIVSMVMISDMRQIVKDVSEQIEILEKKRDYSDLVNRLAEPWFDSKGMEDNLRGR